MHPSAAGPSSVHAHLRCPAGDESRNERGVAVVGGVSLARESRDGRVRHNASEDPRALAEVYRALVA